MRATHPLVRFCFLTLLSLLSLTACGERPGADAPVFYSEVGPDRFELTVEGASTHVRVAFFRNSTGERVGEWHASQTHAAQCPVIPGEAYTVHAYGEQGAATTELVATSGVQPVRLALGEGRRVELYVTDQHGHKLANLRLDVEERSGYGLDIVTNAAGLANFALPAGASAIRVYPQGGRNDPAYREFTTQSQYAALNTYHEVDGNQLVLKFDLK